MAKKLSILCVDSDPESLSRLEAVFAQEFDVSGAATADLALLMLDGGGFEVVCVDGRLPGGGLDLLEQIAAKDPRCERVLLISPASLFLDRTKMQSDSICYVFKPYKPDGLLSTVRILASTAAAKPRAAR